MSPHLEEIEKIEHLLESENFNIDKLNDFSETEKQDILLQKQLVEELTNLQILEELDEIHQQRTSNNFRKKVAGFALFLVLLLSSIGFYLINDVDNTEQQSFQAKTVQKNIEPNQKVENKSIEIVENTISKPLQSGLSWRKNTLIDSSEQSVSLSEIEKTKIRRIHIIDTTQENFFHNRYYATNYSLTTSTVSNEIIVSIDNKFFYLHPVLITLQIVCIRLEKSQLKIIL